MCFRLVGYGPEVKQGIGIQQDLLPGSREQEDIMSESRSEFAQAISDINGCSLCSLANFRQRLCVYRGVPWAKLMIVGEAPGRKEEETGRPMVGPTGSYLVQLLGDNGWPITAIYITNCVLCHPPNNMDPTTDQLDACAQWLTMQIQMVRPQVIIAAGRIAAKRLIPEMGARTITSIEGREFQPPYLRGAYVIPIRHPSSIKRDPVKQPEYEETIARVCSRITEITGGPK